MNGITERIADLFEGLIKAGDPAPEIDTVAEALRKTEGIGLRAGIGLIEDRLPAVLKILKQRGLVGTRVTEHYVENYKDQKPDHPNTDSEVSRSVAGLGRGTKTVALHFCPAKDNCVLSIGRAVHGLDSGVGAIKAETARLQIEKNKGVLDDIGIAQIATDSGTSRSIKPLPKAIS